MEPRNSSRRRRALIFSAALFAIGACSKAPAVKAVKAARTSVEATVTTTSSGTVEAEQQAILGFTTVGRVQNISTRAGDQVKRGQFLAQLENADVRSIQVEAARELERAKQLFAEGLVSQAALSDAQKNAEVARANLERTVITAPFDGIVTEMNLELGELVQAQPIKTPIRLIDLKTRIIKGAIDEADLGKVKSGNLARVKILAVRKEPFQAVVSRVVPFVSTTKEQDRTSQVELTLKDPDPMIPVGASADIEIVIDRKDEALALPTRVVLGAAAERYVFKLEGQKIQKTKIQTGIGNYDRIEVISGLSAGEAAVYPSDEVALQDGTKISPEFIAWP